MSNSSIDDSLHEIEDEKILIMGEAPVPQGGYTLLFSEGLAQEIAEFTDTELFKKLKRVYALQKKDRIGRQALQGATNERELYYLKGMASAVDFFFTDMQSVAKAFRKEDDTSTDQDQE